jgi:hypothetical protein
VEVTRDGMNVFLEDGLGEGSRMTGGYYSVVKCLVLTARGVCSATEVFLDGGANYICAWNQLGGHLVARSDGVEPAAGQRF